MLQLVLNAIIIHEETTTKNVKTETTVEFK